MSDRHLDLGCGKFPRNPYRRAELFGIDVRPPPAAVEFEHRVANLVLEPIPFPDSHFASVSGFDFLEHVPRLLATFDGRDTRAPFIELMDEIWRVLEPGGRLYALTPAFPHADAFTDPTHVNIITDRTHDYFCGDSPLGRMYGFKGMFRALRVEWTHVFEAYDAIDSAARVRKPETPARRMAAGFRRASRWLRGKPQDRERSYLLWELEAVKPANAA